MTLIKRPLSGADGFPLLLSALPSCVSRVNECSTYFGVANWPAEDIFVVFGSVKPRTFSPGKRVFQTRVNAPVFRFRALQAAEKGRIGSESRSLSG